MALEKTYTLVTQLMCQNHILGQNIQNHIFLLFYNSLDIHLSVRMCKSRSCIIHNKQISSSHFATTEFTHPTSICLTLQTKKKEAAGGHKAELGVHTASNTIIKSEKVHSLPTSTQPTCGRQTNSSEVMEMRKLNFL